MNNPSGPEEHQLVPAGIIEAGYLRLPYEQDQFREFIKGLLGRPQSISKTIRGPFEIGVADVQSLSELLTQRVAQQNGGLLATFNARISYSDDSTVEVTSMPELLSYNEVRPVTCRALHLRWDFLVRFQDKQVPEKQSVQVSFIASGGDSPVEFDADNIVIMHQPGPLIGPGYIAPGYIGFRIEHTARSWGADLEALLSSYFKSIVKPATGFKRWIAKHHGRVSLTVASCFFGLVALGIVLTTRRFSATQLAALHSVVTTDPGGASRFVADMLARGIWAQFSFAAVLVLVVSLFLAVVFGTWADNSASSTAPSFILLTRESEKDKQEVLRKLDHKWLSFCWSVITSILVGIVSNVLFAWLFR
jgi:hypothetical protein